MTLSANRRGRVTREQSRTETNLGVVLLQWIVHFEEFRLLAREEATLADVTVEVLQGTVAKAKDRVDFTDVAASFVFSRFAGR